MKDLQEYLNDAKDIVIIPHKNPDGDALGSCLGWKIFLNKKGFNAKVVSPNDYPRFLKWMPQQEQIVVAEHSPEEAASLIEAADLIYCLDFNDLGRIDELGAQVEASDASVIMIDHHEKPKDFADFMISKPEMGSTSEMIYDCIVALDPELLDPAIASCLYTGIMTDTGSFRFPSTTAATHRAVAHLMEAGAVHSQIHQNIYDSYSFDRLRLLGTALSNLKKLDELPVVYIHLSAAELEEVNYQKGYTEGFVNYGLRLENIQLAVIMIEHAQEGKVKMSFRSKGNFPAHQFAEKYFNGGGHLNAAGGVSFNSLEQTVEKFIHAIQEYTHDFS
ncbi:MAG: DHH family phosphoesterase [Flavobacteriaceae bacterium]